MIIILIFSFCNYSIYKIVINNIKKNFYSDSFNDDGNGSSKILIISGLAYFIASIFLTGLDNNTYYKILAICLYLLSLLFSFGNMFMLKAYYMYKYDMI